VTVSACESSSVYDDAKVSVYVPVAVFATAGLLAVPLPKCERIDTLAAAIAAAPPVLVWNWTIHFVVVAVICATSMNRRLPYVAAHSLFGSSTVAASM
jgi:hypothetical protein